MISSRQTSVQRLLIYLISKTPSVFLSSLVRRIVPRTIHHGDRSDARLFHVLVCNRVSNPIYFLPCPAAKPEEDIMNHTVDGQLFFKGAEGREPRDVPGSCRRTYDKCSSETNSDGTENIFSILIKFSMNFQLIILLLTRPTMLAKLH